MTSDLVNPDALNSTIEFLTAMVTPALLISATGSLVLSSSTRLGRVVDRVRQLEERLSDLIYAPNKDEVPLYDKRVEVIVDLLDKVTSRSRILQRAMQAFYYGLGMFVLTSVTIAIRLRRLQRPAPVVERVVELSSVSGGNHQRFVRGSGERIESGPFGLM